MPVARRPRPLNAGIRPHRCAAMDHAKVMNSCSAKGWRKGLSELTAIERVVHLVSWANFEIANGGLSQFFYNSSGENAEETVEGLKAVGAQQAAESLQAAIKAYSKNGAFKGQAEYEKVSESLSRL